MRIFVTVLISFSLLLVACASNEPSYSFDFDDKTNFDRLKTYQWYGDAFPSKTEEFRSHNDSYIRIRKAIEAYLQQRGYQHAPYGKADFLVNYHLSTHEDVRIDSFAGYPPQGGGFGAVSAGTYGSSIVLGYSTKNAGVRTYKEGTAVIDIISTSSNSVVWRGIAEGRLNSKVDLKQRRQTTRTVVKELMDHFPPSPKP